MKNSNSSSCAFCVLLVLVTFGFMLSPSAVAQKFIPADKDTEEPLLLNLGPIGARVKTDHRVKKLPRSESSSATVEYIFENSLAEGKLQIGDVITGVNGRGFNNDFSATLAEAIDRSEGSNGELILNIKREKRKKKITFRLRKIGLSLIHI